MNSITLKRRTSCSDTTLTSVDIHGISLSWQGNVWIYVSAESDWALFFGELRRKCHKRQNEVRAAVFEFHLTRGWNWRLMKYFFQVASACNKCHLFFLYCHFILVLVCCITFYSQKHGCTGNSYLEELLFMPFAHMDSPQLPEQRE